MTTTVPPALADLPPSCKLVWYVLDTSSDPLTRQEILAETHLKESTADYALRRLTDADVVDTEHVVEDVVRPRYYTNI